VSLRALAGLQGSVAAGLFSGVVVDMNAALKHTIVEQLQKGKGHLEYSDRKVKTMRLVDELTEKQLETSRAFRAASRDSRT